jgi:hypothetical protein
MFWPLNGHYQGVATIVQETYVCERRMIKSACSVLFGLSMEEDLICSYGHRYILTVGMAPRMNSDDVDVSDKRAPSISRMRDSRACRRRYACTPRRQPSWRNVFSTYRKSSRCSIKSQQWAWDLERQYRWAHRRVNKHSVAQCECSRSGYAV